MTDWIKVKEHLPDETTFVLVTSTEKSGNQNVTFVGVGWYSNRTRTWYNQFDMLLKVTAWQELPEPYEEYPSDAPEGTESREDATND